MPQQSRFNWTRALPSLVIPICLGLTLYLGISFLLDQDLAVNDTFKRYLTAHPISRITLAMFCIGFASLMMIADNVAQQFWAFNRIRLFPDSVPLERSPEPRSDQQDVGVVQRAAQAIHQLNQYPSRIQSHYLWQRLEKGLKQIQRSDSTQGVEEELKYQADLDVERQQQRYSLVKILVWAIPMLGFLGTVLGISQALGGIQVGPENDFQEMMSGLRGSLYVAFDTTALALALSIVLMFIQFLVDRFESQLLSMVDEKTIEEVSGSFQWDTEPDSGTAVMERMGRIVMATSNQLIQRQAELWQATIQDAEDAWKSAVSDSNQVVSDSLKRSFSQVVQELQTAMGENIDRADKSMSQRWEQWQVMLSDNARAVAGQQAEMVRQSESLNAVFEQVQNLRSQQDEGASARNSEADSSRLDDTLQQLCSAISHLQLMMSHSDSNVDAPRRGKLGIYQGDSSNPTGWKSGPRPISVDTFVSSKKVA